MITLISTAYFPNIFYFKKILEADKIIIDIYEHFPKQTYRNRCEILASNGVQSLIVTVQKGRSGKRLTKDIKISYAEDWQKKHKQAIISAYKSAPYFEFYWDYFLDIFEKKYTFLIDLNTKILEIFFKIFEIKKETGFSNNFFPLENNFKDYRFTNNPKNKPKINKPYIQVFSDRFDFVDNLSTLDLIFNLGPEALNHIINI